MSDVVLTPPGTPAHLMATAQSVGRKRTQEGRLREPGADRDLLSCLAGLLQELSILSLKTAFLDDALVLGMLSRVEEVCGRLPA
jgi:hypothetical protein